MHRFHDFTVLSYTLVRIYKGELIVRDRPLPSAALARSLASGLVALMQGQGYPVYMA
jgi:hypothetical protein